MNTDIPVAAGVWTLLTASNITAARVQNTGTGALVLQATAGASAPADAAGGLHLEPLDSGLIALADMFAGVAGANRLYGWSATGTIVSISY